MRLKNKLVLVMGYAKSGQSSVFFKKKVQRCLFTTKIKKSKTP